MLTHRFWIGAAALAAASSAGCSNLVVKKVPLDKRAEGRDNHIQGFRYYLNRPYLAVNEKILLGERRTLIYLDHEPGPPAGQPAAQPPVTPPGRPILPPLPEPRPSSPFDLDGPQNAPPATGAPPAGGGITATVVDGPRKNQKIRLDRLALTSKSDGAVRAVTPEELTRMKAILEARHAEAHASDGRRAVDAQVRRTQADQQPASPAPTAPPVPDEEPPTAAAIPGAEADQDGDIEAVIQEEQDGTGFGAGGGGGGGSPSAAPAASAPSSTSSGVDTTPLPMPTPVGTPIAHTLVGKMQIIYLPDLDEQYVIKSKNWLAKSAFALTFNDDNSLQAVTGNHDATTVTVSLLQQVDKAISAAQGVFGAEMSRQSSATKSTGATTAGKRGFGAGGTGVYYQLIERFYIKPGLYRLNKPWEVGGGPPQDELVGCGLLAKLGLPHVCEIELVEADTDKPTPAAGQ